MPLEPNYEGQARKFAKPRAIAQAIPGKSIYDESLVLGKDGGVANVFVYLRETNIPSPVPAEPPAPVTLRMKNRSFQPRALAMSTQQPLRIINEESVGVNLLVQPRANKSFNVLFPAGHKQEFQLPNAERWPVPVTSSIQPWYLAFLLVRDDPYFAVSGVDGMFEIKGLPPGDWEFQFWHERKGYLKHESGWPKGRKKFSIGQGLTDLGKIELTAVDLGIEVPKKKPAEAPTGVAFGSKDGSSLSLLCSQATRSATQTRRLESFVVRLPRARREFLPLGR